MTISPADAVRAALFAALIAWTSGAGAQDEPPGDAATGVPRTLPGVQSEQLPDVSQAPAPPPPGGSGITEVPLGTTEGAPAGLLDISNGGLGTTIWSGTPRAEIDKLLEALPIASPVYSERELARRLLLTIADAPIGAAPHAFLTLRLQALMKAGFVLEASIIAANTQGPDDPEYARTAADAILFAGHANDACGNATAERLKSGDRFWMELRAYCYAVAGDATSLDFTRNVMAAAGAPDPAFDTLLGDVLKHKANDPGPIADPTSLHLFLLRQAGLPVNVGLAKQLGMPALVLALDEPRNPPEDRATAAEEVLRAGAVPMAHLIAVADAQKFSPEDLVDPVGSVQSARAPMPFFTAQALLRQAAAHADGNAAKETRLAEALKSALTARLLEVSAGLDVDIAVSLAPAGSGSDASLIARALMLAGNAEAAAAWKAAFDPSKDALRLADFDVRINLVAPTPARAADAQTALHMLAERATQKMPDYETQEIAALALGLYDALGEPVPPEGKAALATLAGLHLAGRRPPEAAMAQLDAATKEPGRKGEALLFLLNAVGKDGPGDLAPDVTVRFVKTLVAEGVPDAARELAIDALLLYEPAPKPAPPPPAAPAPAFTPPPHP